MKTIIASALLLLSAAIFGQQIKFYRTFPKPDWDYADAVIERYDGNYLMAGSSGSQHGTDYDISLILVDSLGNTIWDKYLGQADSMEFAYSLVETADSNYLVSGRIGNYFPYLALIDADGALIREMRYPEGDQCYGAYSVGVTADGNYFFIETGPASTFYIVNPSGEILTSKTYDFAYCNAVIQTSDEGYMLAGHSEDQFGYYKNILIRTDAEGDTLWTRSIDDEGYYDGVSLLQLEDAGFIVAGSYDYPYIYDEPPTTILVRTDTEGDTLWTKILSFEYWIGTPLCIRECRYNTGYILSSRLYISPGGIYPDEYYLSITRLDTSGNLVWSRNFDAYTYGIGNNVTQTSDGGFLLTGHKEEEPGGTDAILIKLDSLGDYVLSTKEIDFQEPSKVLTYPNPVKDHLNLRLPDANMKIAEIRIYNNSGKEMNINPVLSGSEIGINLKGLTPGIYFYSLVTLNNQHFNGKFVIGQ